MELRLTPLADSSIELASSLLREVPREYVAILDPTAPHSEGFVRICSWCKKVFTPGIGWLEVEEAIREMNLLGSSEWPRLTHGICTACETAVLAEMSAQERRR